MSVEPGRECESVEHLRRDPRVAFAELDYAVHVENERHPSAFVPPNDPGWASQWGPARINAPLAWTVVTGTPDVLIAVLDTGIFLDHEDLAARVWTNPREVPSNWTDDDGNGKIDDVHGWHFYHHCYNGVCEPMENADVRDDHGHGTHVAGIAAAAMDNRVGIAGVAPNVRLLPVKVLDQYGDGFYSDLAAGIIYAADNGARVINLSLGGAQPSETLCAAVDYARQHGALVVAAAGNDGAPWLRYPAACESALAVAATDQDDARASFSNYGARVDVAAPGVSIYSTWCHAAPVMDRYLCQGNYYLEKNGTSMAAPHAAGVAALMWSRWPALSAVAAAGQITQTAHDVASPGWDEYTGWGRLDTAAAVTALTVSADLRIHAAAPAYVCAGQELGVQLVYGNGGGTAANALITFTCPVSLTVNPVHTWLVSSLPEASGPYTLTVTTTVRSEAPAGLELVCASEIVSEAELDPADNRARVVTQVGWRVFLPVLLKRNSFVG